jgi:branched-chain amino acid transport system substrate-binding protein
MTDDTEGRDGGSIDRRRFLATTAGVAGVGALAGCSGGGGGGGSGGGSDETDSGSGGGGSTDTEASGGSTGSGGGSEPIKLGASSALTGKYSKEGTTMREGYELWIDQINAGESPIGDGKLLGRDVELVIYDDQSDPSRAVNLYKRLLSQDDVDLLMGPYSSAVSTSVIPIIEQNQKACVMPMMSDTSVLAERDVSYVTQAIAPASTYVQGAVDIAASNGAETVAMVYENTAFPTSVATGHKPYIEEQGMEVVHDEGYPKDINDYTPVLNKVKSKEPDMVMGGGYTPDAIGLTQAAKSIGLSPGIMAWVVGGQVPAFYDSVGGDGLAVTGDLFWAPFFDLPYNEQFVEGFLNTYDSYDDGLDIDYHSVGGYAGCLVMEQAVRNVGELDQAAIAEQLHQIEMEIPFANGVYQVDEQGIQTGQAPSLGQWQEGDGGLAREAVWPSEYATADPIYPHPGWS